MPVKAIPEGYNVLTPYLIVRDAAAALAFYAKAFGAKERMRLPGPGGKVMHAEMQVGDCVLMLADEMPEMGYVGPQSAGGTSVSLMLYDENVDARFARALGAGAQSLRPVRDEFYGDRTGTLKDPFGHVWTISTHQEDVSMEEMNRRMQEMMKQRPGANA